jgi:hypothetical protein
LQFLREIIENACSFEENVETSTKELSQLDYIESGIADQWGGGCYFIGGLGNCGNLTQFLALAKDIQKGHDVPAQTGFLFVHEIASQLNWPLSFRETMGFGSYWQRVLA